MSDPWGGKGSQWQRQQPETNVRTQIGDLSPVVAAMFSGMAQAHCPRQGLSAVAAAVIRTCTGLEDPPSQDVRLRVRHLSDALEVKEALEAQGISHHNLGESVRDARDQGLLSPHAGQAARRVVRAGNGARHKPFGKPSRQSGTPVSVPPCDLSLESLPTVRSETLFPDELPDEVAADGGEETHITRGELNSSLSHLMKQVLAQFESLTTMVSEQSLRSTHDCQKLLAESRASLLELFGKGQEATMIAFQDHLKVVRADFEKDIGSLASLLESKTETLRAEVENITRTIDVASLMGGIVSNSSAATPEIPDTGTSAQPCKFFARGVCARGNHCKFSHESPDWESDTSPMPLECRADVFHDCLQAESALKSGPASSSSFLIPMLEQMKEDGCPDAFVDNLVSIRGLQSAQDLNGRTGRVTEVDHRKRRCGIAFPSAPTKSIKFENLLFPARCCKCNAVVDDLQGCPCSR